MKDKKLTDSEIVKALEDFINHNGYCVDCPSIMKNALDLINRLQAENEDYKALYEGLKAEHIETIKAIKHYKAEAYKEFADRLKEKAKKTEIVCSGALITTNYSISAKNFDNLLKEMTGE